MIKQIDLFCPHCLRKLKFSDYGRDFLTDALVVFCIFCCQPVMNADTCLPDYLENLRKRAQRDAQIRKICSMTEKSVDFVENFISEARLSSDDLRRLVERIARGDWDFDAGDFDE